MNSKQKNIALGSGFLLLLWIVYAIPVHKTLEAKTLKTKLFKEKELLDNASQRIEFLQQKNKHFNKLLKENDISASSSFQQILLKKITTFSEKKNIEVLTFNEPHRVENQQTKKETYFFEVKGNFASILKLTNQLEQQQLGELVSVNFIKNKNYRTNRKYLTAQIYLQKITQ